MLFRRGSSCAAGVGVGVVVLLAGLGGGGCQEQHPEAKPSSDRGAVAAAYREGPAATGRRVSVVGFCRPGGAHVAVPVSLNGGPARAFLLDTGAPVTTVLVSKQVLAGSDVARRRMDSAQQVRVQGISGVSATAYRATARSLAVGASRVDGFPYVVMAAERDLSSLGETPYGPVVGILGNDFLSRYRVTVDYQGGTVSLEER